jgi:hypothetical protein
MGARLMLLMPMTVYMATSSEAADLRCKGNAAISASCYTVRGTLNLSADAGYVLWLGNGMGINIRPASDRNGKDMPQEVSKIFQSSIYSEIVGNFEICPIPKQQFPIFATAFACVESISDMRVKTNSNVNK